MKKRDRLTIIHDILQVIMQKPKAKPTHILYKSNLSHQMLTEYINELIEKGFITEKKEKNTKSYTLTDKGYNFISDYSKIKSFIESYGLD